MASETITRNDLTNILNEVLPPATDTDTGWQDLGGSWAGATRKYRVRNGVCFVTCAAYSGTSNPQFTVGTWTVFGTLPAGARPSTTTFGTAANRNGVTAEVQITTSGDVYVMTSATTQNLALNIAFPVG